jgi:hypothetical protein
MFKPDIIFVGASSDGSFFDYRDCKEEKGNFSERRSRTIHHFKKTGLNPKITQLPDPFFLTWIAFPFTFY